MTERHILQKDYKIDSNDIPKMESLKIGNEIKLFRLTQVQWSDKSQKFVATYHEVDLPEVDNNES